MPKADTSVKWFHSEQADAPVLNGQAGSLIAVLDACLLNGFSVRTPDSVVVSGGVATVGISTGNPYEKSAVIEIGGASDPALNGQWRIGGAQATSFTFNCPGVADGTVTGASVKRAPAGWAKPFAAANMGVYQSADPASTQLYLRVDDSDTRTARLRGYEDMTDVTTGTGPFPTIAQLANGVTWAKSNEVNSNPKKWALFADGFLVYFYQATYGASNPAVGAFGDFETFTQGDRYNCIIAGSASYPNTAYPGSNTGFTSHTGTQGVYMARRADQITPSVQWYRLGGQWSVTSSRPFGNGLSLPSEGGIFLRHPFFVSDSASNTFRGVLPGMLEPMHRAFTNIDTEPFDGEGLFSGRTIVGYSIGELGSYGSVAFDITGPWR